MHKSTLDNLEMKKNIGIYLDECGSTDPSMKISSEDRKRVEDLTIHQNTAYHLNQVAERMIRLNQDNEKLQAELGIHKQYMSVIQDLKSLHKRPDLLGESMSYNDVLVKESAHLAFLHRQRQNDVDQKILQDFAEERSQKIAPGERTRDEFDLQAAQRKVTGHFHGTKSRKLASKKKTK